MLPLDLPLIIEWLKGHKSAGVPLFQFSLEPSPSAAEGLFLVDAFTNSLVLPLLVIVIIVSVGVTPYSHGAGLFCSCHCHCRCLSIRI